MDSLYNDGNSGYARESMLYYTLKHSDIAEIQQMQWEQAIKMHIWAIKHGIPLTVKTYTAAQCLLTLPCAGE